MTELYGVLGLQKGASAGDIKAAYHKEALAKHPDRGGNKEEFQRLQSAYEVLSDPGRRAHYDATGDGFGQNSSQVPPDLSAMFGSIFGGGGIPFFGSSFGPRHGVRAARGPNRVHDIGVGLADLYRGRTLTLNMKRDVLCHGCAGEGGSRMEACRACGGKGFRIRGQQMGPIMSMIHEACAPCDQSGKNMLEKCGVCAGKKVVESESSLNVVIEPGMADGDRLTFAGQCSESPMFEVPGDVILVVRAATTDSVEWVRSGADLTHEVRLTLAESLLGWGRHLAAHPSGRPLHLVWKEGVLREGEVLRVQGWGMPRRGGGMGDLRLVCRVAASQGTWSEEQLRALKGVWPDWTEPVINEDTVLPSSV